MGLFLYLLFVLFFTYVTLSSYVYDSYYLLDLAFEKSHYLKQFLRPKIMSSFSTKIFFLQTLYNLQSGSTEIQCQALIWFESGLHAL